MHRGSFWYLQCKSEFKMFGFLCAPYVALVNVE